MLSMRYTMLLNYVRGLYNANEYSLKHRDFSVKANAYQYFIQSNQRSFTFNTFFFVGADYTMAASDPSWLPDQDMMSIAISKSCRFNLQLTSQQFRQ